MYNWIEGASPAVQAMVLISLGLGSVISWAVILFKIRELRAAESDTEEFVQAYHERPIDAIFDVARQNDASPLSVLFMQGYRDLSQLRKLGGAQAQPSAAQVDNVVRRLEWTQMVERQRTERGLSFLATTGSIAPFVGLLGTVIGIMNSFEKLTQATGAASIQIVGPGIAEALLATAVGLFAAIPAVVGFNYLSARVERLAERLETFRLDFTQYVRGSMSDAA